MWNELSLPAEQVAPRLLGSYLVRVLDGHKLVGKIVETEAYSQHDAASHSFKGITPRTEVMFGPAGILYVYFTYGMHYCMNVVAGKPGEGTAVLIRAIEPLEGETIMMRKRDGKAGIEITNGPAKTCQALSIDRTWNGHDLRETPLQLLLQQPLAQDQIMQTTRIGVTQAQDVPWRFYIRGNRYVSKT